MHMNDVAKYAAEKEHLMREEGKHPANDTEMHRAKHQPFDRDEQIPQNHYGPGAP
jgi:hypothetical protein